MKCYCVTWRNDDSYVGNDHWYPTEEERRAHAIQFVKAGSIQGYLAYHGDEIVGWCNATGNCLRGVNYLRAYWPIEESHENIRVKSIFCFMIAPNMQRQGIATQLTERICNDAAADGFEFVEAYAYKESGGSDHEFGGPLAMYEKCGFYQCGERDGRVVMRKALK
ncbi:MAG TPA: GNAT family N-acetyltransferase [Oscillospiraceae bacterium]|nr:GNAT family N-acetyltransferase [Oscillospiraceae bacterium]HPF56033.1 GNAT family N-acetyltransferase [Clostridiales bacterium]HPK35030.1 GNAT family N-acetyltransferase [Oscillospiraceae bacterium]HPR76279.1 GNAT family N-acetyltransferase [Oscillospiraceae bacterium]